MNKWDREPQTNQDDFYKSPYLRKDGPNWCQSVRLNKPQGNACTLELILFFNSGILFGSVVFSTRHFLEPWAVNGSTIMASNIQMMIALSSFLFATAIGGLIYPVLAKLMSRKILRYIPSALFYICGVLFVSAPQVLPVVIIARVCGGLATAMILCSSLTRIPEISAAHLRGMYTSVAAFVSTSFGLVLIVALSEIDNGNYQRSKTDSPWSSLRIYGILIVLLTTLANAISLCIKTESPVYLLQQGDTSFERNAAKQQFLKLRYYRTETDEMRQEFEDLVKLVEEDRELSTNIFTEGNLRPLILVIIVRLACVFSFNFPVNMIRLTMANARLYTIKEQSLYVFAYGALLCGAVRAYGQFGMFALDKAGRKKPFMIFSTLTMILGFTFTFLLLVPELDQTILLILAVLAILYDAVQGVVIASVANIYTAEAFALPKKVASIGFTIFVEYLAQGVLLVTTLPTIYKRTPPQESVNLNEEFSIMLASMIGLLLGTVIIWFKFPETKMTTIREARYLFKGPIKSTFG